MSSVGEGGHDLSQDFFQPHPAVQDSGTKIRSMATASGLAAKQVSINGGSPKRMVYNGKSENPIKMDDKGVPPFQETSIYS